MTVRGGLSVGGTTDVPSLSDQVRRFKPRTLVRPEAAACSKKVVEPTKKGRKGGAAAAVIESLVDRCIRVIIANFEWMPVHEGIVASAAGIAIAAAGGTAAASSATAGSTGDVALSSVGGGSRRGVPAKFLTRIAAGLPLDLDPTVASLYVFDENYFKRRCVASLGWERCQIVEHGLTWKQLFFEAHATTLLENYGPAEADGGRGIGRLLTALRACQDYVFSMTARQLLGHPDMQAIVAVLPNLAILDLTYGVKRIGMQYERMLFGMKISDAASLAKGLQVASCLTTLILQCNLIDDDLVRMLMTGLVRNATITSLDVSHNRITNHGARLLAKLLNDKCVLASLSLADNHIHGDGGRHLGRALRGNDSLTELNLRLNRLGDDGGRLLLEGLRENGALTSLNLAGNSLGRDSVSALGLLLRESGCGDGYGGGGGSGGGNGGEGGGSSDGNGGSNDKRRPRLACVDLSCNEIDADDVHLLRLALERNSALTSLDLRQNRCPPDCPDLAAIDQVTHRNELALLEDVAPNA